MDDDKFYTDDSNNPQAEDAEPKEVGPGEELDGEDMDVDPEVINDEFEQ